MSQSAPYSVSREFFWLYCRTYAFLFVRPCNSFSIAKASYVSIYICLIKHKHRYYPHQPPLTHDECIFVHPSLWLLLARPCIFTLIQTVFICRLPDPFLYPCVSMLVARRGANPYNVLPPQLFPLFR